MTVTVYGLPPKQCRDCWATEKRLEKWNIPATKVLLTENPDAKRIVEELGYNRAPVVVVTDDNGDIVDHWGGFSEIKIKGLAERLVS